MDISTNSNRITIEGNIKSNQDFQTIKNSVDSVIVTHKSIIVDVKDSMSFTSATIGYFNKIILKDKVDVHINVGDKELYNLLDDLNLTSVFKLKRI